MNDVAVPSVRPVALVTGGGSGIGAAIATAFASEAGMRVAVTGRDDAKLAQTVGRINASGGQAIRVVADVRNLTDMRAAVDEVVDRFGELDVVVANAGIQPARRPVTEYSAREWADVIQTNLTGVWTTASAATPALVRAGGGAMIIIGSGMMHARTAGTGAYAAAKAGAQALARMLALELRPHGIAVNTLVPGPTRTPGMGLGGSTPEAEIEERWRAEHEWLKEPEDVARLALYIVSLPTQGPTGQVFSLAGRLL